MVSKGAAYGREKDEDETAKNSLAASDRLYEYDGVFKRSVVHGLVKAIMDREASAQPGSVALIR